MLELPDQLKGCKVFPCRAGKEPATKEGWHIATDDPAQIAEWSRINPDFNWAVATGPSGLFVIDVDPNGLDWWGKLLERDSEIRQAVERAYQVRTPRGGLHVYFRAKGRARQAGLRKASTRVEELTGTVASCRAVMSCFPDLRLAPDLIAFYRVEPLIHCLLYCPRLFPSARKRIRLD